MARTAFRLTYEWRCSRQARIAGINGSSSSGSFSLQRNRSVEPRMNSFGCCKSCHHKLFQVQHLQQNVYIISIPTVSWWEICFPACCSLNLAF